jgi:sugar phosphate isomerase/epimerase
MDIKNIALSTSAFGYSMGSTGKNTERKNPNPWTIEEFVDFSYRHGFGGIEAPIMRFVPDLNPERLKKLKELLSERSMFFLIDAEAALDVEQIRTLIPIAKQFGSPIIRIKTSDILGCARKKLGISWAEHINNCISVLKDLAGVLRSEGIKIAIENHQDVDSSDLVQIIEVVGSDVVGVNFDIGNAFSVCEEPVSFASKVAPYILNIHLKDYKIFESDNGFKLVRCPIGEGSVNFKEILSFLAKNSANAKMAVELGAQEARNIAWLEPDFWDEILPRLNTESKAFSELLQNQIIKTKDDSWNTKWEAGAAAEEIVISEITELETSINYLKTL